MSFLLGNFAHTVHEIERRAVEIGSVDEQGVSIRSGLTGRESVVVSAGPFLNPGQKVAPRRSSAAAAR